MTSSAPRRPRRITIVAPDLAGGGVTRAYLLARVLQRLGHDVSVLGGCILGARVYPDPPAGLTVRTCPSRHLRSVVTALLRDRGEIVYAVKPRVASFGVAMLASMLRRRPVVLDVDDWELSFTAPARTRRAITTRVRRVRRLRHPHHRLYLRAMEALAPRASARTVTTTFLEDRFGGVRLPNGADTALFDPARWPPEEAKRRLGLAHGRVLMFAGTPAPHKGIEDILAALETLADRDCRLVLAGGRPVDRYLETLRRRWDRLVVTLPPRGGDAVPQLLAAADAIVVPQRDTPTARAQLPMKLFEAMAMARPIVATAVGDLPAVVGDGALVVSPSRSAEIASALDWIFARPEEAGAMGRRARERCVSGYGLDALGAILAPVIDASSAGMPAPRRRYRRSRASS